MPRPFNTPISTITDDLYLCGVGAIREENLQNKGITHILNTAEELEDFRYPVDDMVKIRHILMRDNDKQDLLKHLDMCVDHIDQSVKADGHILVHCIAGVSRSASVCMAYLVKYRQMTLRQAYQRVMNKRPCINPNFGFWRQLHEYELRVRGKSSVEMLPFVLGTVPDFMMKDAEHRIKLAWMDQLLGLFFVHFVIMVTQIMWSALV